jgi:hypothetical protein
VSHVLYRQLSASKTSSDFGFSLSYLNSFDALSGDQLQEYFFHHHQEVLGGRYGFSKGDCSSSFNGCTHFTSAL